MKKSNRFWIRALILIALFSSVGFALYQNFTKDREISEVKIGQEAPNFQLKTASGQEITLQEVRGKGVLLNFWATWCKPCEKEMPAIQEMYTKYEEQGLVVLAVNLQETAVAVNAYAETHKLTFPILLDSNGAVNSTYSVTTIPSTFFIDTNGKIKRHYVGEMNLGQLETFVQEILPK